MKKAVSILLASALCVGLTTPALAYTMARPGQFPSIGSGSNFSAAVQSDGSLWMWGGNEYGQLGNAWLANEWDSYGPYQTTPAKVMDSVKMVSCGDSHAAAIKEDGSLWTWGLNAVGQLGNYGLSNAVDSDGDPYLSTPTKILDSVTSVSCGSGQTAAITTDGSLWMWGNNDVGQLGNGQQYSVIYDGLPCQNGPVKVMDSVIAVSCGYGFTAAITSDYSLWMWGYNDSYQLGNGGVGNARDGRGAYQTTPVKIMDSVVSVSCGYEHTAAVRTDGTVWTWGANYYGQLGNGGAGNCWNIDGLGCQSYPVQIAEHAVGVSCGENHTAVLKDDGTLWTCGENTHGQLGNNGLVNGRYTETSYLNYLTCVADHVSQISCGDSTTLAVRDDGTLWSCGRNDYGQVGNSGFGNGWYNGYFTQTVPMQIMSGIRSHIPVPPSPEPTPADQPSDWAASQVHTAIAAGIVPETLQNAYQQNITRAEFCALAVRFYEQSRGQITQRKTFADTSDPNVEKMGALGVVSGVGDGSTFDPNGQLTREQAATILARLVNVMGLILDPGTLTFADNGSISSWAAESVAQMSASGIMQGIGNNKFEPQGSYTREQSILTVFRIFNAIK